MYYEEKLIDDKWVYRLTPTGKWIDFTEEKYTKKIKELQDRLSELYEYIAKNDI